MATTGLDQSLSFIPLLAIAALVSPVSQATIAPVYGALPAAINHQAVLWLTLTLGFSVRIFLNPERQLHVPIGHLILPWLVVWASWIPMLQSALYPWSTLLGVIGGPALLSFLSCHVLVFSSAYAAADAMNLPGMEAEIGKVLSFGIVGGGGLVLYAQVERIITGIFPTMVAAWDRDGGLSTTLGAFSPVKLQLLIALGYFILSLSYRKKVPWWLYLAAIGPILHALLQNPHLNSSHSTTVLKRSLATHDWTILDRQWSTTGYVSVVENTKMGYRVLRCDHSLLGGEWIATLERQKNEGWKVNEPVFTAFQMLEAIRLIETKPKVSDTEAQALFIGLGIGTAPKAFVELGITSTIVELDPVVHRFATQYFGLPGNHTARIQDAVVYVDEASVSNASNKFDYIVHDVFTGGAEPLALFTNEFLRNLRSLLRPSGVVAINYAGDLTLPLTTKILYTITQAFDGQCRIFRDAPPPPPTRSIKGTAKGERVDGDFLNLVVFCHNMPGTIRFRKPVEADFLKSISRKHHLLPNPDYEIVLSPNGGEVGGILRGGEESEWTTQQARSATRHWRIMRTVVPDVVWEMW